MIVLLARGVTEPEVAAVVALAAELGLELVPLDVGQGRGFEVVGPRRGEALRLTGVPGVAEILTRRTALTGGEPLWPHLFLRVGATALLLLGVLVLLAAWFPPGLAGEAGAVVSGDGSVEWFLRLPALLLSLDSLPISLLVPALWLVLFFWPFLDRFDPASSSGRVIHGCQRGVAVGVLLAMAWLAWGGAP